MKKPPVLGVLVSTLAIGGAEQLLLELFQRKVSGILSRTRCGLNNQMLLCPCSPPSYCPVKWMSLQEQHTELTTISFRFEIE